MPHLTALLDAAASLDPRQRFDTAGAALRRLRAEIALTNATDGAGVNVPISAPPEPEPLRPNVVERVKDILRSYPGSRFGNVETRGLDSAFASDTYVETGLDTALLAEISPARCR